MRKITSLLASVAMFGSLGACNNADTANLISKIQQTTVTVCKFLPTVETVANILTANAALVPMQVAEAICAAVMTTSPPGAHHGESAPPDAFVMVGKQKIFVKGQFVQ